MIDRSVQPKRVISMKRDFVRETCAKAMVLVSLTGSRGFSKSEETNLGSEKNGDKKR